MQREAGKYYVYNMSNGLLVREATSEEIKSYKEFNVLRLYEMAVPLENNMAVEKFNGEPQMAHWQ